jgi:hypothetical protein
MDEAAAEFEELFSLNWNYFLFLRGCFLHPRSLRDRLLEKISM